MIATWGWVAGIYGAILASAALLMPAVGRRPIPVAGGIAYALAGLGMGTLVNELWVQLVAPGILLLTGYWLSGLFFRDPQPRLEQWLLASDRRLLTALRAAARLARAPRWVLELVEAAYTAVYAVVGLGAIAMAWHGLEAVAHYWTVVLTSGLSCYVTLPWLRARPPRALEPGGMLDGRLLQGRRFNLAILDRASVQANTIPSGHVACVTAAALAVFLVSAAAGWVLMAVSMLIAVAATVGRYHYAVDCAAGAVVAAGVWWLLG